MAEEINVALIVRYPQFEGVLNGPIELSDGATLNLHEVGHDPTNDEAPNFQVLEMPVVRYMALREHGLGVTAIPVFPVRRFIQWMVEVAEDSDIHDPSDLQGKRIASYYHGHTDAVWSKGVLQESYGLDPAGVSWITVRPERVLAQPPPDNVVCIPGADLNELLMNGTVDATLANGYGDDPPTGVRRLWADPEREAADWFKTSGFFPMVHLVLVRDAVLAEHPSIARELYQLFERSKNEALVRYDYGATLPEDRQGVALRSGFPGPVWGGADRSFLGHDPLPYGVEENRASLERVIRYAFEQGAVQQIRPVEELFPPIEE